MEIKKIDINMFRELIHKAENSERNRVAYDLRNSPEDTSQRMLNALMPGTEVPIHRHEDTSETCICIYGKLSVVFYDQLPNGEFKETERYNLDPTCGHYGIQIPKGAWHTVDVAIPSMICSPSATCGMVLSNG